MQTGIRYLSNTQSLETQVSKLRLKKSFAFGVCWILISVFWPATCQAQVANDQATTLTTARDFLQVTYPELPGRNLLPLQRECVDPRTRRSPSRMVRRTSTC